MPTNQPVTTAASQILANIVLKGFDQYFSNFQEITRSTHQLFEQAKWTDIHQQSLTRLDQYKKSVLQTIEELRVAINQTGTSPSIEQWNHWPELKKEFEQLTCETDNRELAESFFNSIYCALYNHRQINDHCLFVHSAPLQGEQTSFESIIRTHSISTKTNDKELEDLFKKILSESGFTIPFENLEWDIQNLTTSWHEKVAPRIPANEAITLEILKPIFYRNKGSYIVGRILHGEKFIPFILPIIHNENNAIYVDTLIDDPNDASMIFSFTRSYFMVETTVPSQLVNFLRTLMPHKEMAELYNAIGLNKHGKTEFYRSFVNHLDTSDDQFVVAPGIKGMVMSVFTLPSYDIVFKVIKDHFDPPKDMSRETVMEKYRLVSRHDRVGRMADTQEYSFFHFPRKRFSDSLIKELKNVAPSVLEFTDDEIIIKHLYTERKMTPLNLFLNDANEEETEEVMDEYGNAIKQISSADIFPGDMLLKNFGVTRHNRVVFYDYDEICFLHECNFRKIPEPKTEEQAMASQPWYSVGPNDIFPEEFRLFFTGNPTAKKLFEKHHSDLYQADFWQQLQQNIAAGKIDDMFPYRRKKRFARPDSTLSNNSD